MASDHPYRVQHVAIAITHAIVGLFIFATEKALGIAYAWAMQKTPDGFDILVNGIPRTFRDTEPAAYEAALLLKKRWPAEIVTIKNTVTGVAVMMCEDGRTA